jgi:intracellular sulfur oxidation DsrE/DsrF family protein
MKLRTLITLAVLGCASLSMTALGQAKAHKVLFSVTSPDEKEWGLVIGNIRNLVAGLGEDTVDVEVVAFGPGLSLVVKGSPLEAELQALEGKHVKFVACQNAMRARKVTADDLQAGVGQVPAGIIEVVTKQEQGWTYVKGGY